MKLEKYRPKTSGHLRKFYRRTGLEASPVLAGKVQVGHPAALEKSQ
jgi:hypothetical protein